MIQTFWIQFDILLQLVKKFPQLLQSAVTDMVVAQAEGRHLWLDKSRLVFSVPIRRIHFHPRWIAVLSAMDTHHTIHRGWLVSIGLP